MIILNIFANPKAKNFQKIKYTISSKRPIIHINLASLRDYINLYAFLAYEKLPGPGLKCVVQSWYYNQFLQYLMQNEPKPCTIEQTKTLWNGLAPTYNNYDSVMETFYYTLANMLRLNKAKHIYEVGCGTGRLIPYTIGLKPEDCTYLATDLSEKMIESARHFLGNYIHRLGVSDNIDKWQERQRLEIGVHDGESSFKTVHKFDRIIANLVLQTTPDPRKMMTSLREVSEEGCLLGVSIWGDKSQSNFFTLPNEVGGKKPIQGQGQQGQYGKPGLGEKGEKGMGQQGQQGQQGLGEKGAICRQNFHLYNKLEQLGSETGWELIVQWDQNSPLNSFEFEPEILKSLREVCDIDASINTFVEKRVKETFSQKKTLNFPVQMAIFRRK